LKALLSNALLVLVSIFISVLLLEGACRVIYSQKLDYQIEMSRYAATLKRTSKHPAIGHEHRPSSEAHLMGVDVTINAHGFRDSEYPVDKPDGELRIMLLGDSLTLGWGAAAEDTFATRLEDLLADGLAEMGSTRPLRVINTGVGNYNTDQEVSFFETRGRAFDPDVVVLNYFINDAEPTPRQKSSFILKYTYLGMSLWGRLDVFKRLYLNQDDFSNYYPDLYEEDREGWRRAQEALGRIARLAEQEDFVLLLVLLPELHSVGPEYGFREIHTRVQSAAEAAGIEHVLDLSPLFASEQPEQLWVSADDAHPNARAHAIIAQGTYDELMRLIAVKAVSSEQRTALRVESEEPKTDD
jgi:lysophospholipase L1-like esterase